MWMSGNSAAHITAKMVMASAERLIDVRHSLAEEQQDGRDERARVADADPEHEVGDVEGPAHGLVQPPGADAGGDLVGHGGRAGQQRGQRRRRSRRASRARAGRSSGRAMSSVIWRRVGAPATHCGARRAAVPRSRAVGGTSSTECMPSGLPVPDLGQVADAGPRAQLAPAGGSGGRSRPSRATRLLADRRGRRTRWPRPGRPAGRRSGCRRPRAAGRPAWPSSLPGLDALDAQAALLHDAARAHHHVGVQHHAPQRRCSC